LSDQSLTNQQIIVISQAQEYKRQFSKLSSQKDTILVSQLIN